MDKNEIFKSEIMKASCKVIENFNSDFHFQIISLMNESIIYKNHHHNFEHTIDDINVFKKSELELKNSGTNFSKILSEKLYCNIYANYEEFIFKMFYILYVNFPRYLLNENEKTIGVEFEDVFENQNINVLQNKIIELKVKSIIQSNSVEKTLIKFNSLFHIKIDIDKCKLDDLCLISTNRNLLIHNSGIINSIYLNDLKKFKLTTDLAKGDYIFSNNNDDYFTDLLNSCRKLIMEITKKISDIILSDFERLEKHHSLK